MLNTFISKCGKIKFDFEKTDDLVSNIFLKDISNIIDFKYFCKNKKSVIAVFHCSYCIRDGGVYCNCDDSNYEIIGYVDFDKIVYLPNWNNRSGEWILIRNKVKEIEEENIKINSDIFNMKIAFNSYITGVENIFNEFKEIKEILNIEEINKKIIILKELKEKFDLNIKYMESDKFKDINEFMCNFINQSEYLIDILRKKND